MHTREAIAQLILRAGLAFAFLYPPINALTDPLSWIGYFPHFLRGFVPDPVLLHWFGIIEVVIALWILSGKYIFWPCLAAALMLLTIVVVDFQEFQVLFRDLAIAAIAIALAIMNVPRTFERAENRERS